MCKPAVENSNEDPAPEAALLGVRSGTKHAAAAPQAGDQAFDARVSGDILGRSNHTGRVCMSCE